MFMFLSSLHAKQFPTDYMYHRALGTLHSPLIRRPITKHITRSHQSVDTWTEARYRWTGGGLPSRDLVPSSIINIMTAQISN